MRFFFVLLFSFVCFGANSQNQLETVVIGDSVYLNVTGMSGTIQWQESTDSLTWIDITGAITNPFGLISTSSVTGKRYYRAVVVDTAACNEIYYSFVIRHRLVANATDVVIGNWFRGGIVFNLSGGGNGLIGAQYDQTGGSIRWGCAGVTTNATSLTDGAANTAMIMAACSSRPIAASLSDDLVLNGYSDWYLPAMTQLTSLYQQRALFSGWQGSNNYFSSTEENLNYCYVLQFWDGAQAHVAKNYSSPSIRSIRSFSPVGPTYSFTTLNTALTELKIPVSITGQSFAQTPDMCVGSEIALSVTAEGTPPITYQWRKNGLDIFGANGNSYTKNNLSVADEGIYTCIVTNECISIESIKDTLDVIMLYANAGTDINLCNGADTTLQGIGSSNHPAESGVISYAWVPITNLTASNISNPVANPVTSTDYTLMVTDQHGCSASDVVNVHVQIPYNNEQICLVTVDTNTWKNKIMWEKTAGVGTQSYNIYKEVALNVYNYIGAVQNSDPAYFIDNSSQPEAYANRYKISVVDICNAESAKSYYHMTMNLTIAANGSTMGLNWSDYVEESGSFQPSMYYIYRGTSPFNMQLLASVPGSVNSYNDVNVYSVYYYLVGVEKAGGCDISKTPTYSFSNKKDNGSFVGINGNSSVNSGYVNVYPNPFNETAEIEFNNPDNEKMTMTLSDSDGRLISKTYDITGNQIVIERKGLCSGLYFIEIKGENRIYRTKIIVN